LQGELSVICVAKTLHYELRI